MNPTLIIAAVSFIAVLTLILLLAGARKTSSDLKRQYSAIIDVEAEAANVRTSVEELRKQYAVGRGRFEELQKTVSSLEENLEDIEVGLYKPHFTFENTESYKAAILAIRDRQKTMIKDSKAVVAAVGWTVSGSKREGEKMLNQSKKVILRAFNSEAEAAIANVSWNNLKVMEARIEKAYEVLNKHGTTLQISISNEYKILMLDELHLVFETAEQKRKEQEEERQRRAEQREEEKVQRELQREQDEATKEEAKYQKLLDMARADLEGARDAEREQMAAKIQKLQAELEEVQTRKERAIAQAQLTKVGHVYIISNVGAYGDDVLKIGMTRRLDPEDRVRELSDASVPFSYDIHAMIYSENAPELEARLQKHFWEKRLNWANDRKEFFRVNLDEVQEELGKFGLATEVLKVPEAREYRQTLAMKEAIALPKDDQVAKHEDQFPEDPFTQVT